MTKVFLKKEHFNSLKEGFARQKIVLQGFYSWDCQPDQIKISAWSAKAMKTTVEVSLIKDCPTSYKWQAADSTKPLYIAKNDPRFTFAVQGNVLQVTGTIYDLVKRKFL